VQTKIRFDIINNRKIFFIFSGLIILTGIASMAIQQFVLGIDFTGGRILQYKAERTVTTSEVEGILTRLDIKHNPVQLLSGNRDILIRTADYSNEKQAKALDEKIRDLKIAFNVEFRKIDPNRFELKSIDGTMTRDRLDEALEKAGLPKDSVVIDSTKENPPSETTGITTYDVTLKINSSSKSEIKKIAAAVYSKFGGYQEYANQDKVDPVFGIELKKKAYYAMAVAVFGILIYVTLRFEFWFAVAAVLALVHDCLITLGFYSVLRLEVDGSFVAVILTVLGYSINDTIVIFDRIRENMRKDKKSALDVVLNMSLWETMARSINTVLTVELTIVAILVFGGHSIRDFMVGMCIGITWGCYSSIFIAAPLAYMFKMAESKRKALTAGAKPNDRARSAASSRAAATGGRDRRPEAAPKKERAAAAEKSRAADTTAASGRRPSVPATPDSTDGQGDKKKKPSGGKQRRR